MQLAGFGTIEVCERKALEGRNPSTGEAIKIAAQKATRGDGRLCDNTYFITNKGTQKVTNMV